MRRSQQNLYHAGSFESRPRCLFTCRRSSAGGHAIPAPDAAKVGPMDMMKIVVTGAAGRMGRELIRAVHGKEECVLSGAIEQKGSLALGQDAGLLAGLGKLGVVITDDPLEVFAKSDAVL